jgi:type 1 glutamine amidotransferase
MDAGPLRNVRVALALAASLGVGVLMVGWQPVAEGAVGQAPAVVGAGAAARGQRGGGPAGGAQRRKRVLAWADTRNGIAQHESVGHALATIERLGYQSGMWDTDIRTDSNIISKAPRKTDGTAASGGPSLANVDAIFFEGHRDVPLDADQKAELLQFVRDGHGFVAAHVGLTAFESWPEFGDLIGARFDGHPITGAGTVINEDPAFPATKHFPASFPFSDEFYQPTRFSREKIDVLLRLDVTPGDPRVHPDADYPLAWAKLYGQGRVFYSSFAHASETWDLRDVQQMYFEAMRWALGLTDGPPTPHEQRVAPPARRGQASR